MHRLSNNVKQSVKKMFLNLFLLECYPKAFECPLHELSQRKTSEQKEKQRLPDLSEHFPLFNGPTRDGAVLRSKQVDGRCQIQSPVTLVDIAIGNFP